MDYIADYFLRSSRFYVELRQNVFVGGIIWKMSIRLYIAVLLLMSPVTGYGKEPSPWFLMSRHGECFEIGTLKRKIPDLGGILDSESFIKLMESKNYKVKIGQLEGLEGKAVQVSVPAKGLDLIFVKKSICQKFINR